VAIRRPGGKEHEPMSRALIVVLALLIVAGGLILWGVGVNNRFVGLDEAANSAWSQVENDYQRRLDLIPNLVETVKGVASFEQSTYTAVAEARARAGQLRLTPESLKDPQALAQFEQAQGQLSSALSRLLVTVEQYPELKANQNFLDLQTQLEGTENRIAVERKRFNETVQAYNVAVRRFPAGLLAGLLGYAQRPYFQAREGADQAPAVQF
jgi:LemA protein